MVKLGQSVPPWVLLMQMFRTESGTEWWIYAGCHPTISIKASKGTQSTYPNQGPGLLPSSSTTGLLAEGTLQPFTPMLTLQKTSLCLYGVAL